jgi:hypothetical protein
VLAYLFASLFVMTAVLALWLTAIEQQLFNSQLYKNALAQEHVYYELPGLLSEILTTNIPLSACAGNPVTCEDIIPELKACYLQALGDARYAILASGKDQANAAEQALIQACLTQYDPAAQTSIPGDSQGPFGLPAFMKTLPAANWVSIINLILPPQELQNMLEGGLDQTFAYLNGESDRAGLSLVKLKAHLTGPAGTQSLLIILHSQPACTTEELSKIVVALGNGEILICNPLDDQTLGLLLPILQEPLNSLVMKIPDEAILISPPPAGSPAPGSGPFGSDPITSLRIVRRIMGLSPIFPLAFLLMVAFFGVRSAKSWLQWWGIPMLIAGAVALGLAGASMLTVNWGWNIFILPQIPTYLPTALGEIGRGVVHDIMGGLVKSIVFQALILTLLGSLAWAGSFFVKSRP